MSMLFGPRQPTDGKTFASQLGVRRLLIVEPDAQEAERLKQVFGTWGYKVDIADEHWLELPGVGKASETDKAYDAILIRDTGEPKIVGEALQALAYDIPAVIMSADPEMHDVLDRVKDSLTAPATVYTLGAGHTKGIEVREEIGIKNAIDGVIARTQALSRGSDGQGQNR